MPDQTEVTLPKEHPDDNVGGPTIHISGNMLDAFDEEMNERLTRQHALELSLGFHEGTGVKDTDIIKTATRFAAFIFGDDISDNVEPLRSVD